MDCGITGGIGADCSALRRIGGVNKRAWIYNRTGVSYTENASGYITGFTFPTYEGLYAFESVKKSHSGGYTLVVQEGANKFFQHDVILKLFATTPSDDEIIEDLAVSDDSVIILETNNKEFKIFGIDNGMGMTAAVQNSGTAPGTDTTDVLTFAGEELKKPRQILISDYLTTLAYLENLEV